MENVNKCLDEVIACIKNSSEYQMCLSLKEKMSSNEEICSLVEQVKKIQKKYVKSQGDTLLLKELENLEERLQSIPIYYVYQKNLELVNEKIQYVTESLNDYFSDLFNQKY